MNEAPEQAAEVPVSTWGQEQQRIMNTEEKYVVFKMSDYERIMQEASEENGVISILNDLNGNELDNFVVIRLQDQFAAPALYEYGNAIQTLLDFLQSMEIGPKLSHIGDVSEEEYESTVDRLIDIRNYFFTKAEQSKEMARKLPD